eukprot:UN03395
MSEYSYQRLEDDRSLDDIQSVQPSTTSTTHHIKLHANGEIEGVWVPAALRDHKPPVTPQVVEQPTTLYAYQQSKK